MAFQFMMWVPEVAMVPKGMLVDRSGEDAEDGKTVPRPSEARPEDDDEDMLMPPIHELFSGRPTDLVKVRLLALTKLVLASEPAFAQYSSARLVHDVHVLEASAWPGLAPRPSPSIEAPADSKALPSPAKTAPVMMPVDQSLGAASPKVPAGAGSPSAGHEVTASAPPGAVTASAVAKPPSAEAFAPAAPPVPAAGVIEVIPSSERVDADAPVEVGGAAPAAEAAGAAAPGHGAGGPSEGGPGAPQSAPAAGAAHAADALDASADVRPAVTLSGVDDDAAEPGSGEFAPDGGGGSADIGSAQSPDVVPFAPPDDDDASAFVKPPAADASTGRGAMIVFRTVPGEADHVLSLLAEQLGIGRDELPQCGTVSIMPVELTKPRSAMLAPVAEDESEDGAGTGPDGNAGAEGVAGASRTGKAGGSVAKGLSSKNGEKGHSRTKVRARVLVDKILDQIAQGAALSFDYVAMVSVASILAGVGLATNNAVVIVASMLVSPLMAPVLALTFGLFICDWRLARLGFCTELVGLLLCVFFGFLTGLVIAPLAEFDDITGGVWPTSEMTSRGTDLGLIVGVVVALASGCGVALGIAGNNVSGLVGVAISASLLPPIVNAGMLWSYALSLLWLSGPIADVARPNWPRLISMGGFSLALALVNIVCIIIAATGMFMVKEVAPIAGKSLLFSGTTAAVRRMFIARSSDQPGQGGADAAMAADAAAGAALGAAAGITGPDGTAAPGAGGAPAAPRKPRPIGMERAIRLVVDSGWHREIAKGRSDRNHRGGGSAGGIPAAVVGLAGSASAVAAQAKESEGRPAAGHRGSAHRTSADGYHATVGHGARGSALSGLRRRAPRTQPRRAAAVELASGDRFGIRATGGRRRRRRASEVAGGAGADGGDDDDDEFDTYEVTRQLDMSDMGGRSMWGGKPQTLRGQVDASLSAVASGGGGTAGAAGGAEGAAGRMGLSEIMSRLARGRPGAVEEESDEDEEDEDETRDLPGRMPSRAARDALSGATRHGHQRTLGMTQTVMSRRRLGTSVRASLGTMKWS